MCPSYACMVPVAWQALCPQERDVSAYPTLPVGRRGCTCVLCESHPAFWGPGTLLCNCNSLCIRETEEGSGGLVTLQPMDCSPPGPSVHSILQARTLEWVAIVFFRGSSWPGIKPGSSALQTDFCTVWVTRAAWGKWIRLQKWGEVCIFLPGDCMIVFTCLTQTQNFTKPPKPFPILKQINRTLHWSWIRSIQKRAFPQQMQGIK